MWQKILRGGVVLACLAAGAVGLFFLFSGKSSAQKSDENVIERERRPVTVKSVRPKLDKSFQMTLERPASVEAYYRVDLEARVPGEVSWVRVAPGAVVKKGQDLVKIYVPDRVAAEKEKAEIIVQRDRELALNKAKAHAAAIAVETARANVEEKKTLLKQAKADTLFREQQFGRLDRLWRSNSIDKDRRDEAARNLEVARAAEAAAIAVRVKAEKEVDDALAQVAVAKAEVARAEQLVSVARSDHELAKTMVNYATVKAPFRGVVVSRKVNPGSFVQNASTGHPTPLLTLERADIVTVVMRVPDTYASLIKPGTEAVIHLTPLPGVEIRGKVTRFAPSLETASHDRTMRVEVDLWNRSPSSYKAFFSNPDNLADLKEGLLPLVPEFKGKGSQDRAPGLLGGMYGNMTLVLRSFGDSELIPSEAVLRQGGRAFIYAVREGKAHRMPVEVQRDDGNLANVVPLDEEGVVIGTLNSNEEIIVSNQEELSEGQPVATTAVADWGELKKK